jgi:hypothetical protein
MKTVATIGLAEATDAAAMPDLPERFGWRVEQYATIRDAMLRSDLDAPKKQRHTARHTWRGL